MRVLILGSKGQLGRDLEIVFRETSKVVGYDLPEVDIADWERVRTTVHETKPDLVVNAAAYTDVEKAEDDPETAFRVNRDGAGFVATASAKEGIPVVYISTDYVFGGNKATPYEPEDPIHPLGVYAKSKAEGEAATREGTEKHFILRTAWLYGPGGNHFAEKIIRAARSRPELKVVEDEVGSPTHTLDLARAVHAIAQTEAYGTHHTVNAGSCTRYEYAKAILQLAGLQVPMHPCSSSEFPTKAPRPAYSVLSTATFEAVTGHKMRHWREALEDYMRRR